MDRISYNLPLTSDGDRTFSCPLGSSSFAFRSYYVDSSTAGWYLDIYDSQHRPLALGRKIITGSVNALVGFANALDQVSLVVYDTDGMTALEDALGTSLRVMWFPVKADNFLKNGDPMNYLFDNFQIAQ